MLADGCGPGRLDHRDIIFTDSVGVAVVAGRNDDGGPSLIAIAGTYYLTAIGATAIVWVISSYRSKVARQVTAALVGTFFAFAMSLAVHGFPVNWKAEAWFTTTVIAIVWALVGRAFVLSSQGASERPPTE